MSELSATPDGRHRRRSLLPRLAAQLKAGVEQVEMVVAASRALLKKSPLRCIRRLRPKCVSLRCSGLSLPRM